MQKILQVVNPFYLAYTEVNAKKYYCFLSLTGRTICFHSHLPTIFKMCLSVRKPEYI